MKLLQQLMLLAVLLLTLPLHALEVASLQRGMAVSNGNGSVTVSLGQTVDPARSVLFFSSRHNSDRAPGSMIRGRLTDTGTISFDRVSNESATISINWTLVEFVSGVSVQRGSFSMTSSVRDVVLASPVASTSQAFVLWSKTAGASDSGFDEDDPVGGYLLNAGTLRFHAEAANASHLVDYQVVEYTNPGDLFVQSGVAAMGNGSAQLDVTLPTSVNTANTLVLAGYSSNGSGNQIARRMLNVELRSATSLRFTRERTGSGVADVVWQVVEFRDGTSVQQGMETFSSGEAIRTVTLTNSVDPSMAVAFSGMQPVGGLNMGSSSYQSNDIIGTGSYTFDLSSSSLTMQRNNVAGDSTLGWSVLSFSNLTPVLNLQMDELVWTGAAGEVADSASGIDGTAVGGITTAGDTPAIAGNPGTCRYGNFDGVDDHVVIPDDPTLNGSAALVYSAWINPRSWSGVRQVMAKSVHGGGSGRAQMGIFSEANRLVLRAETLGGRREVTTALPALNVWSHVAGVFAGNQLRLYVNGVLAAGGSFAATTLRQTTDPLLISKRVGSSQYFFDGFIDEVSVYTQVLNQPEIVQLMNATHPCPMTPKGNWYFDEVGWNGTPDEVRDYSGNDYNGRAINVVTRLGRVCNAADLGADGTTDYLSLDSEAFDGLEDFTIAVWYRGAHSGQMSIVSGSRAGQYNELIFFFDATNRFRPYLFGNSGGSIAAPGVMDGNWHFLVWTREGADNCLYVDDVLRGCVTRPVGPVSIAPGALIIGQEQDLLGGGFVASQDVEGDLDELLLFDSALGAAELAQIRANNIAGLNWDGAARACPVTGATGFVLNHDNQGIYCLEEPITVSAVDALSQLVPSYVNSITLQTSTGRGSWRLLAGSGALDDGTPDDGQAVYGFSGADNGSATFALSYPEGDSLVEIDVYQSNDVTVRDDDADGPLQFAPSGFTLSQNQLPNPPSAPLADPLLTQLAGNAFALHLSAYGTTDDDPQCGVIESYSGSRNLKFSMTHLNPATSPRLVTVDGQSAVTNPALATAQAVNFVAGQAQVAVNYKDVGEISLRAEDDGSFPQPLIGSSNSFVVRPVNLVVTRIESSAGVTNPAAADMNGDAFVPAGESFHVDVAALDTDGDITPSFGAESPPERVAVFSPALLAPAGGRNGSSGDVSNGASFSLSATAGVLTNNSISFDETGIISLQPRLVDSDYLGTGDVTGLDSGNVGRFYPARFELVSDSVSAACSGFTYMSEPALNVQYRLQALNVAGDVTWNYDSVDLGAPTASVTHVAENADDGVVLAGRLSAFSSGWDDGEIVLNRPDVSFARAGIPDGPFENLQLGLRVNDPLDPVPLTSLNMNAATAGDCVPAGDCDARSLGAPTVVRYGRLMVLPSFGPEDRDLFVGLEAQTFANGVFRQNLQDSCSTYAAAVTSLSNLTGNLISAGTSVLAPSAQTSLVAGAADTAAPLTLAAPGIGYDGTVDVLVDVGVWLEFDWSGGGDTDPLGTATFGRYRGHDRIIFWLEER